MGTSRELPRSSASFWTAIDHAKDKKDDPPAYGNILTAATGTRLDAIFAKYGTGRTTLSAAKAMSGLATRTKNGSVGWLRMLNSHYIQVLNMHIAQKKFLPEYRVFFQIPSTSAAVPPQGREDQVKLLAQNILAGEPQMITAGGTAIPFPLLADVAAGLTDFNSKQTAHSNKIVATNTAEEALDALNPEALIVVRKVWDEVETYFNDQPIESRRNSAREWGVVYVSDTDKSTITGRAITEVAGVATAVPGAIALLVETDESVVADVDGNFALVTAGTGKLTLRFSHPDFNDKDVMVDLGEGVDVNVGDVVLIAVG